MGDDATSTPTTRRRVIDGAVTDLKELPDVAQKMAERLHAFDGRRQRRNHDSADFAATLTELLQ